MPSSFNVEDVASVAEGLTRASQRAVLRAEPDGELGNYFIRFPTEEIGKPIHDAGLTTLVWSGLMLNRTGLAVRQHLMEQSRHAD